MENTPRKPATVSPLKKSVGKKWKAALKKAALPSRPLGWKAQGSGKRLPLKHHK